ncbi:hypothetical protein CspHIS471_0603940 [Cutaneotrichosporon sp. HIS471]|nr:hypothetical protein CspHIS471_0603940 [Cutaneotrichosporon sp. HIS471]
MPAQQVHTRRAPQSARKGKLGGRKPDLVMDGGEDPSQWLGFSLPPRGPTTGLVGPPRRSRRGDAWKGSALTREKFVNASFRFMLKPTDVVGYGAHFADPDISLHWPNILQVLVPTFSAYSVAQGFVDTDTDDDAAGEEAAERRRRIEEERQGRSCPICLSKPVAGRMTKCGHIFCLPCILHFIALSEVPKAASCPICGDTIHEGMLKSVRYLDAATMVSAVQGDSSSAPSAEIATMMSEARAIDESEAAAAANGDETASQSFHGKSAHRIHMRLLHRPQMTTLALPATATWPSDAIPPISAPWYFLPDVLTYSRFALASPEYMLKELQRELAELKREWDILAGDELGRSFVKVAREKVERQVGKVEIELMTDAVRKHETQARRAWNEAVGGERREQERQRERERQAAKRVEKEKQDDNDLNVPLEFLAASAAATYGDVQTVRVPPNVVVEPNPMPNLDTGTKSQRRKSRGSAALPASPAPAAAPAACFYQSSLGAHVYLSALDMRILLTHFVSYDNLPPTLSFSTTGYDSGTVTEELRKRTKYLSHLPVGTEVVFVEANLVGIVPADVLAKFEQPLKTRRDKRRARTRREDRDKKRWEEAERAKRPPEVHVVHSALAPLADAELAMALERSRLDAENAEHFPSMDAGSPPRPTYAPAPPSPVSSFASALRGPSTARLWGRPQEDIDGAGVDAAWAGFQGEGEPEPEAAAAAEGRKKKGNKKGKKLVFGGAGRQA